MGETCGRGEVNKNRSYCDVVKGIEGEKSGEQKVEAESKKVLIQWRSKEEDKDPLKKCLVGYVKNPEMLETVRALCSTEDFAASRIKLLGGRNILLQFETPEAMASILDNKSHEIHKVVKDFRRWTVGFRSAERLLWLKIKGVPLHAWNKEVFSSIGAFWGHIISIANCEWEDWENLAYGKVLVATSISNRIMDLTHIKIDNLFYRISISEEDMEIEGHYADNKSEWDWDEDSEIPSEWSEDVGGGEVGMEESWVESEG